MPDLNEDHARILCNLTGTEEGTDPPADILAAYWKYKYVCDRISIRVTEQDLAWMCVDCGYSTCPTPETDEAWQAESRVAVKWGSGKRKGTFKHRTAAGECVIVLDGEGEERKFDPKKVSDLVEV